MSSSSSSSSSSKLLSRPVKSSKRKRVGFKPQKSSFQPPHACWEVILANPQTIATLKEWYWLWLLPQVCSAFKNGVQSEHWFRLMCASDTESLIWKGKANALFALTRRDMYNMNYTAIKGKGYMSYKEVHLMRRDNILELALAKHGDSFAAIKQAFRKRLEKRKKRRLH